MKKNHTPGMQAHLKGILENEAPFDKTESVWIELSNICNYSYKHNLCPVSTYKEKVILPAKIVYDIIDTLGKYNFKGYIVFNLFGEPMLDPRLFVFLNRVQKFCPEGKSTVWTNCFYLTQTMLNELEEAGVYYLHMSAYSEKEFNRLMGFRTGIKRALIRRHIGEKGWADVLGHYDREYINEKWQKMHCFAPLHHITVVAQGDIILCCRDWKHEYCFGNLYKQSFEEIIKSKKVQETYERLIKGERFLEFCKRCKEVK